MPDPGLTDIQNTLDAISKSVLRLPESRPSQFAPEWVSAIGDLIRACDALALALAGYDAQSSEADVLLAGVRAQRRLLFLVIAEADHVVELGEIEPENVVTQGIFVDYIVDGGNA